MILAVLSGKGGTGKSFVSVNLACAAGDAVYVDCDVEEPNGHIFLKPEIRNRRPVTTPVPRVDGEKCNACHACVDFCRFHALALAGDRLLVFDEVCHSCGGCVLVCPRKALSEHPREIGCIEEGVSGSVRIRTGRLNIGEASGVPIIKELLEALPDGRPVVIDCPPGSACIVMESIQKADYCLLVAEPTLFGVHNLKMVYELSRYFKKPVGVVLNKCLPGKNPAKAFCREQGIPVLAEIPFDQALGRLNGRGLVAVREDGGYRALFTGLLRRVEGGAAG